RLRSGLPPPFRRSSSTTCSRARSRDIATSLAMRPLKSCAGSAAILTGTGWALPSAHRHCQRRSSAMAVRLDHGEDTLTEVHEINVTPFIDVMLVLLIIFMVAAPLATVDIVVNLPSSTAQPQPRPDKPLFLTVKSDLSLALGDEPVAREAL